MLYVLMQHCAHVQYVYNMYYKTVCFFFFLYILCRIFHIFTLNNLLGVKIEGGKIYKI